MDQQKPGGFHYPTLIKYYIHPSSFLKVGNYGFDFFEFGTRLRETPSILF
jgi:hypothetical protein